MNYVDSLLDFNIVVSPTTKKWDVTVLCMWCDCVITAIHDVGSLDSCYLAAEFSVKGHVAWKFMLNFCGLSLTRASSTVVGMYLISIFYYLYTNLDKTSLRSTCKLESCFEKQLQ